MTPYYGDHWLTVYLGDCRAVLAELPAESVHTVITSPPYWGLRDYGTATWVGGDEACDHLPDNIRAPKERKASTLVGTTDTMRAAEQAARRFRNTCRKCGATRVDSQLGLEPTPEQYVENMVAVFREVRRVLRSDGTVWLNLGSSYMSAPAGNSPDKPSGFQQKSRAGRTGALAQFGGSAPTRSRRPANAPAYGSDDTRPRGSSGPGSACSDLCDGCRAALSSRTTDTPRPLPDGASPRSQTGRGTELAGSGLDAPAASPLDAPASTTPRSETPPPGPCSHCGNCGVCLAVMRSPSRDARECVRRSVDTDGIGQQSGTSDARTSGTASSGLAWGDYTSTIKPKDMVPIPWMVAMALQADGWYLRSDIIWSKPNPMPESVTDRPTKAHEYVFLLSKSARYYFDADAVREDAIHAGRVVRYDGSQKNSQAGDHINDRRVLIGANTDSDHPREITVGAGRNLRSVWTIATQPYPGAHFATFPEALVEPCVKAGCPEGGVVLDPFAGSGTTARVANRLSRRAVLIDLNADYLEQVMDRNRDLPLGLGA